MAAIGKEGGETAGKKGDLRSVGTCMGLLHSSIETQAMNAGGLIPGGQDRTGS